MYDAFSTDYDYFVNWPERLKFELPFLEEQLQKLAAPGGPHKEAHHRATEYTEKNLEPNQVGAVDRPARVLDAACGTGRHVIALRQRGYAADGADLSAGMIERARANAAQAGVAARFEPLGFGQLAGAFRDYDAVLCLGNSLPHVLGDDDLKRALADFAACLRPGGLLLIQNRNFDAVLRSRERWMGPEAHRDGEREWIFVRFYDFDPDGKITFNILTLYREGLGAWEQRLTSTRLSPLLSDPLVQAVRQAGFEAVTAYGGLNGSPYAPESSGNLVIAATRSLAADENAFPLV